MGIFSGTFQNFDGAVNDMNKKLDSDKCPEGMMVNSTKGEKDLLKSKGKLSENGEVDTYDLRNAIDEEFEDIVKFHEAAQGLDKSIYNIIDEVKSTRTFQKWNSHMVAEGYSTEQIYSILIEAAKKAKKKKDDDLDLDDDDLKVDDSDGEDKNSSDDGDGDSKKDKKGKKSSKKDSKDDEDDFSDDDDSDEKKSSKKKKKDDDSKSDDDSEDKDDDKKKKSKSKSKKKKDDSEDDDKKKSKSKKEKSEEDEKLEESGIFKSGYGIDYDKMIYEACYSAYHPSVKRAIPKPRGFLEAVRLERRDDFVRPHLTPEYDKAIREYFDLSDHNTRLILTAVDEEDQSEVLHSLTDRLYDVIVNKAQTIDYGDIPSSKGDITKMSNYSKLTECVEIIKQILIQYKQDTTPVEDVETCISNIEDRKDMFVKGFKNNTQLAMFTYNSIVLAVVAGTSLLISGAIEYIKNPDSETFQISFDKVSYAKAKDSVLFNNIRDFNSICKKGELDKALNTVINGADKQKRHLLGFSGVAAIGVAGAIAVILYSLLPILREITYFFYYTRTRISDYFNTQADLLIISSENIKNGAPTVDKPDKVINRQRAIADRFRKIADFIMIDAREAERKSANDIKVEERKLRADEVMDDIPDSAASSLF